MRQPLRWSSLLPVVGIALAACADPGPLAPEVDAPPRARLAAAAAGAGAGASEVCHTITFDGLAHGANVDGVTVPGFGFALTLTTTRFNPAGPGQGMAFSTNNVSAAPNDGTDLEHSGPHRRCPGCAGLGSILVIRRTAGSILDYNGGGTFTFAGFPAGYYLKSYTVVDNDDYEEAGVQYLVGGIEIASSNPIGDGSVQTVVPATQPIIPGSMQFRVGAPGDPQSGGIDNLVVCRRAFTGCTRTIGYWKNHDGGGPQPDMVSQYLPIALGDDVVDNTTESDAILGQRQASPSNGLVKLRAQLLAAMLNVEAGADPSSIAATIAAANAFLDARDVTAANLTTVWAGLSNATRTQVTSWASQLDGYNNGPLHCDD